MDSPISIELALLEGMTETLLLKLREKGITTREALQSETVTPDARRELAEHIGVPHLQLDAIHLLNFVLPEERAARMLEQESAVRSSLARTQQVLVRTRVWTVLASTVGVAALLVALFVPHGTQPPTPYSRERGRALEDTVSQLRSRIQGLRPVVLEQSKVRLAAALRGLAPAPGWYGPLTWSGADHENLSWALSEGGGNERLAAVSLALRKLDALEDPARWERSPWEKAQEAADLLRAFPPISAPRDGWDLAAAATRLRLAARSYGLVGLGEQRIDVLTAESGFWDGGAFAPCEALLVSLENLPVRPGAEKLWMRALPELRRQANTAKNRWSDRPEAWAREYWVLRADLEFLVVAGMLGAPSLEPYASGTPRAWLQQRTSYLEHALAACPAKALGPLAWLRVEFAEAASFLEWVERSGMAPEDARSKAAPGDTLTWVEALAQLEGQRFREPAAGEPSPLLPLVQAALEAEGYDPASAFTHPRTRWEAGLCPMLMETRLRGAGPTGADLPGAP